MRNLPFSNKSDFSVMFSLIENFLLCRKSHSGITPLSFHSFFFLKCFIALVIHYLNLVDFSFVVRRKKFVVEIMAHDLMHKPLNFLIDIKQINSC